jgi:hypothetical protein
MERHQRRHKKMHTGERDKIHCNLVQIDIKGTGEAHGGCERGEEMRGDAVHVFKGAPALGVGGSGGRRCSTRSNTGSSVTTRSSRGNTEMRHHTSVQDPPLLLMLWGEGLGGSADGCVVMLIHAPHNLDQRLVIYRQHRV